MLIATLLAMLTSVPPHEVAVNASDRIEVARLVTAVKRLQSLDPRDSAGRGTRVSGTDGERLAAEWVAESLRLIGYRAQRQVFELEHVFDSGRVVGSSNIIATLGPEDDRLARLVVVAHIDSKGANDTAQAVELGWSWTSSATPGADDNASGCAALLEVARVLKALPTKPRIPIDFVWAGGEEMAMLQPGNWMVNIGAEPLAEGYLRRGVPVLGAIAVDMLLRPRPYGFAFRTYSDGRLGSQVLADAIGYGLWLVSPQSTLRQVIDPAFAWSDHGSFWGRGWPGVLFIEDDFHHERYHRDTDFLRDDDQFYDPAQLHEGAKIIAAAIALLAY